MGKRNHGICLYMTVEEFFTEYVKNNNLEKTEILIVSRDVVSDIKKKEKYNYISYTSKYDNIEFVPELLPTPASMEFAYGNNTERFEEAYDGHLRSDDTYTAIICIADMVVNDGLDVILLSSKAEFASRFPYILKDFVYESLGMKIRLSEELIDADSEEEYESLIDDIGEIEDIRTMIEVGKKELMGEANPTDAFFNQFMEDADVKYRKLLMTKDVKQLVKLGTEKGLRMSRRKSKEELVDMLVKEVFGE